MPNLPLDLAPDRWRFALFPVGVLKVFSLLCFAFVWLWAIALSLLSAVRAGGIGAIESISQQTKAGRGFDAQNPLVPNLRVYNYNPRRLLILKVQRFEQLNL
jgi:hypothetical protein